jgi:hypothetical protein
MTDGNRQTDELNCHVHILVWRWNALKLCAVLYILAVWLSDRQTYDEGQVF